MLTLHEHIEGMATSPAVISASSDLVVARADLHAELAETASEDYSTMVMRWFDHERWLDLNISNGPHIDVWQWRS